MIIAEIVEQEKTKEEFIYLLEKSGEAVLAHIVMVVKGKFQVYTKTYPTKEIAIADIRSREGATNPINVESVKSIIH